MTPLFAACSGGDSSIPVWRKIETWNKRLLILGAALPVSPQLLWLAILAVANLLTSSKRVGEALSPVDVGLPHTRRRRVRGLRREEVAEAAGISIAWYTWIEQARDLNISEATLENLSRALHLGTQEREHMFQLAGHPAPQPRLDHSQQVLESVKQVIASMDPNPSYVLDTRWNLLAWNRGARELFGDFGDIPEHRRNLIRLTFLDPQYRQLFINWSDVAHCTMAHFRTDSVAHVDDPSWLGLIDELTSESHEFKEWWANHNVTWPHNWQKEVIHPQHGRQFYNTFDLELFRPARLRVVTYIPVR